MQMNVNEDTQKIEVAGICIGYVYVCVRMYIHAYIPVYVWFFLSKLIQFVAVFFITYCFS